MFPVKKDRPILFSALATADVLLTLDRADFGRLLGTRFYGLAIMTPGLEVLVQDVIAAMTTSPWPRSKFLPATA